MIRLVPFAALAILAATPARAQDSEDPTGGDRVTIGAGIGITSSYAGAAQSMAIPAVAVQGDISGIGFSTQGTSIFVDAVPGDGKPGWKAQLGPLLAVRLDRTTAIRQPEVARLGKLRTAWEAGAWAGVQRTGVVTSDYDTLSFNLSWQKDVAGAHRSFIVTPGIDYDTPLSHHAYVSLSLSADYGGRGFGDYYFDISPAGSAASGLPAYSGAARTGWKDWNASGLLAHSLTGDLRHGLGAFVSLGHQRLLGADARSPIVAQVGRAGHWSGGGGLEYTF